jgi:hypothetical protein
MALIGAALALGCFAGPCAASSITWSAPGLIDQRLPFAVPAGITDPTCPSVHLCVGTQAGGVEISRHPLGGASAWAITALPVTGSPLSAISCASPRLCVAVSEGGQVFTSTNPAGGAIAWKGASVDVLRQATALSCPRVRFCVALEGVNVVVSTNPTRARSWRVIPVSTNGALRSIACPSRNLCVATVDFGGIWTTTTPTGPGRNWKPTISKIPPDLNFDPSGVACPSVHLCVVTDEAGNIFTSTEPARRRWKSGWLPGLGPDSTAVLPVTLTCPSVHLCLSLVGPQAVVLSTNPAGGARTWRTSGQLSTHPWPVALTCASARLCVATSGDSVLSTPHPAAGAAAWRSIELEQGYNPLTAIACPSDQLCIGLDAASNLITSSAPSASATAWNVAPLAFESQFSPMPSLACPSVSWCAATTSSGLLITSADPSNAGAWSPSAPVPLFDVSCPTVTFCASSDYGGAIHISANPSSGAATWSSQQLGANPQCEQQYCTDDPLTAVSCPSTNLCATMDTQYLWVSTNPGSADAAWTKSSLPNLVQSLYCPTDSLCLAWGAALEVTTDPADAAPHWTAMTLPKMVLSATLGPAFALNISGLSCVSTQLCVAVDSQGGFAFVGDPTEPDSWTATKIDNFAHDDGSLTAVSCTPTGQCVAVDGGGDVIIGTTSG